MAINLIDRLVQESKMREDLGYIRAIVDHDSFTYECPTCFAIIEDWKGHQAWHEKLRRAVNEAEML